jgi:hypothetical protein
MMDLRDTLRHIAAAVVQRLAPLLEPDIVLTETDGSIVMVTKSGLTEFELGRNIKTNIANGVSLTEAVAVAVYATISELQDVITREFGQPWPTTLEDPRTLLIPFVDLRKEQLTISFGSKEHPAISLIPISLDFEQR